MTDIEQVQKLIDEQLTSEEGDAAFMDVAIKDFDKEHLEKLVSWLIRERKISKLITSAIDNFSEMDLWKFLYALINKVGGVVTIQKSVLKGMSDNTLKNIIVDDIDLPNLKAVRVRLKKKRERGIIQLRKDLIVPDKDSLPQNN